jgi:hypothetical protein
MQSRGDIGRSSKAKSPESREDEIVKNEPSLAAAKPANREKSLPQDFQPKPYSIIIGRGKESKGVFGNHRLRVLATSFLPKYSAASNKGSKSKIVSSIVRIIRDACPTGAFIRLGKDGRWDEVDDAVAREKVGYTFRELLSDRYRSSSKSKVARRHQGEQIQESLDHEE